MPWLIVILLIVAANVIHPDPAALSGPMAVYAVFAVAGLMTGWLFWYRLGWNAHVENKRRETVERAEDQARKERK